LLVLSYTTISNSAPADKLKITNVTAAQPVVRGVENEFTVEVEYNLESADEGEINLGFNSEKPIAFRMADSMLVQKGTGTATLKTKVIPVDWGTKAKFMVMVNLSKHPHETPWKPLASDRQDIVVNP
jgi:hypothetical protein